ncbi:MAG: prepilin peptidase [Deltaproteobacteria bacterium]|nr:prepilin peptidase [Deltaproteobacteria bacterium]
MIGAIILVLGLLLGSFLNVCITRLPQKKSLWWPRSYCDSCHKTLSPIDLIPVLSFLIQKGHCRYCKTHIPVLYPIIEVLTASLLFFLYLQFDFSLEFLVHVYLVCVLIVLSFIDLKHYILPDVITLPSIVVGLIISIFTPHLAFRVSLLGLIFGGGILYAMGWVYHTLTKREGMGGGDIKLMAMLGAFLGVQAVFFILFVSCFLGSVWGGVCVLFKKSTRLTPIPFGPFIALATLVYIFFGIALISWYQNIFIN